MTTIENELFRRPAHYWLQRAQKQKQSGDLIRAAVLERHAVRAEPDSEAARMSYAYTLRQLHCYEASNREAFAALARDASRTALFGLIGQNMLNMGMRQTGLDALNLYAAHPPAIPPVWQDEAYDMADAYDYPFLHSKRRARLDGLLQIALRRIAKGDLDNAIRALNRAMTPPFRAPSARRELALAACFQQMGDRLRCLQHVQRALRLRPQILKLRASAIVLLDHIGCRAAARRMLLQAALLARTPVDELLLLTVCDELRQPQIALILLRRSLNRTADRFPVCYNLCVCLLRMGRWQEAMSYIHLCREIDPDDVEGDLLFNRLMELDEEAPLSPKEVRKLSHAFGWYGSLTQVELAACAQPLWPLIQEGPAAFSDALVTDERLRRRYLYLLALPLDWPAMVLTSLESVMPREALIALLREVLLQHPGASPGKKCAMSMLSALDVPPPYAVWMQERIALVDPSRAALPTPTFVQRILTLRIRQARKLAPSALIPWAMALIARMDHAQRRGLINDYLRVWPVALAAVYRASHGLAPLRIRPAAFVSPLRRATLVEAMHTLHHLERRNDPHENHRL